MAALARTSWEDGGFDRHTPRSGILVSQKVQTCKLTSVIRRELLNYRGSKSYALLASILSQMFIASFSKNDYKKIVPFSFKPLLLFRETALLRRIEKTPICHFCGEEKRQNILNPHWSLFLVFFVCCCSTLFVIYSLFCFLFF